jgi:hypothetical protein
MVDATITILGRDGLGPIAMTFRFARERAEPPHNGFRREDTGRAMLRPAVHNMGQPIEIPNHDDVVEALTAAMSAQQIQLNAQQSLLEALRSHPATS